MKTLNLFASNPPDLPMVTAWALNDLGEAKGKQELFTRQSPQRLRKLRESAIIESAVSSNRIEGVEVEKGRLADLMSGKTRFQDRNEEEVRGYRDALNLIHQKGIELPINEKTILHFHKMCRGDIWDAGVYKERDIDIIEHYPDGRSRVRFRSVSAKDTPGSMVSLIDYWGRGMREKWVPSLLLLGAFNLDFLCIHPFRDGNGRVSRLLLLQCLYHCGFEVGRYISLERLVEENKERYLLRNLGGILPRMARGKA